MFILQLLQCSFSVAVLLTLHQPSASHWGLVRTQISDSEGLGAALELAFYQVPGNAKAAGPGNTL